MTAKEAARVMLEEAGEPLHYDELTERILAAGEWETEGKTPSATVSAQIARDISRKEDDSVFQRVAPGVFALREWGMEEYASSRDPELPAAAEERVRLPLFPTYSIAAHFLRVLEGETLAAYRSMKTAIQSQTGTPKNPVNWQDPDSWIDERLKGDSKRLARRFWEESNHELNPRYSRGPYFLCNTYDLFWEGDAGQVVITPRGQRFLDREEATIRRLDEAEGIDELLSNTRHQNARDACRSASRMERLSAGSIDLWKTIYLQAQPATSSRQPP